MTPRRPRDIGTAAETAVVRAARAYGFPWADRTALHGRDDVGDVTLCPGVIVEVKGGETARTAADGLIERWLLDTIRERENAHADVGLLVLQRPRVSAANAHRWWVWWRLGTLTDLVAGTPVVHHMGGRAALVRTTLGDALRLLRLCGYGDPLDAETAP